MLCVSKPRWEHLFFVRKIPPSGPSHSHKPGAQDKRLRLEPTSPKGYLGVGGKSRLEPQITNQKGCIGQKGGRATPPLGPSRVPTKTLWDLLVLWTPGRSFPSLRPSKSLMKNSGVCTVLCRVGRNKAVRLGPPRHALPSCHLSLSPLEQQRLLPSKSEALQSIDLRHLQSRLRLLGSPAAIQTFEVTVPEAG